MPQKPYDRHLTTVTLQTWWGMQKCIVYTQYNSKPGTFVDHTLKRYKMEKIEEILITAAIEKISKS